jgi:CoA:oxalate CoA-transferase
MNHPQHPAKRPLEGLRVLDLTVFLSGPYGTQILGDLGAEVIKLEPAEGDQTRFLPPHFLDGDSAYFLAINRNKQSVQIDYKKPEGRALLERLVRECDVVVENLRPGNLARYGIDYAGLAAANPRLIWCSISGFGQDGPHAQRPAYDMIVQALSGGMSLTGEQQGKPVRAGVPLGDISAGMYAVIAILAALRHRDATGEGEYIDISMLDCQVAMLSYQAAYYLHSGKVPGRQGRGHESIPTYRSFTAGDGVDFVICANTDRMWHSLCKVIAREDLSARADLQTRQQRYALREEIWSILEPAFLARPAHEWVDRLHEAEVPTALVNTLDKALSDDQVLHREMVVEMERDGVHARVAGDPIKMKHAGPNTYAYPPKLGANTADVVQRILGMSSADVEKLSRSGILKGTGLTPAQAMK